MKWIEAKRCRNQTQPSRGPINNKSHKALRLSYARNVSCQLLRAFSLGVGFHGEQWHAHSYTDTQKALYRRSLVWCYENFVLKNFLLSSRPRNRRQRSRQPEMVSLKPQKVEDVRIGTKKVGAGGYLSLSDKTTKPNGLLRGLFISAVIDLFFVIF